MLTKKTAAGIGFGSFIIAFGTYLFIITISSNAHQVSDVVDIGKNDVFKFDTQKHFHEQLNVTGNSFHVKLKTPSNGLQVDDDFKKETSFDWYSLEDGQHFINITNTGDSILHVTGTLEAPTNPLIFTSIIMAITSGVLIVGMSAAFTIRKPRGF